MEGEPTLLTYPYVLVRIRCDQCKRSGSYRLARLASKYGADFPLNELLGKLAHGSCEQGERRRKRGDPCRAYFRDLEAPQPPPDLPGQERFRALGKPILRIIGGARRAKP